MSDHADRQSRSISPRAAELPNPEPRYAIAVVAARTGVQITTIRRYEEAGVVASITVATGGRLYSEADIDRIWRARRLIDDLGVNLAGAAAILHLREQLVALQHEYQRLRERGA